jgi:succinyl-diaminopimelate desuccinylase
MKPGKIRSEKILSDKTKPDKMRSDKIKSARWIDKDQLVKTLQSLIRIPSFEDSLAISRWVKDELEGIGYQVWSDRDGNLMAEVGKGPGFILNAHLDTVPPGDGWKHDPFEGKVEKDRIYGRGASDDKGGVASIMEIARALRETKLKKRVVFTMTAFEEGYPIEKNGIYRILPKLKDIEKGIILEPTTHSSDVGISVGCRGAMRYYVTIKGVRAHSAYQPVSLNPIYKFPRFLDAVKEFPKDKMEVGMLGTEVEDRLTVTEICAKEGGNVFPGECSVTIDRRALPTETPEEFHKKMVSICDRSLGKVGKDYGLMKKSGIQGYLYNDREFLKLCESAVRSIKCKPNPHFKLARTDASILHNFAGIGTFMIGPGDMNQAHAKDEHIEIKNLDKVTRAVLAVIKKWDGLE